MPKLEAYVAIENTVAATIGSGWTKRGAGLKKAVEQAVADGDYAAARQAVTDFDMKGQVLDKEAKLTELMVSAMVFGASQLSPVKDIGLLHGSVKFPDFLDTVVEQMRVMVEDDAPKQVKAAAHRVINEAEAEAGLVLKAETAFDLGAKLNAAVLGNGKGLINIGANLTTSRLVTYGFLAEAVERGITTYQLTEVLDTRICEVCRTMHGKTFEVASEIQRVEAILRTRDPQQLKTMAPWPSNSKAGVASLRSMSEAAMQAQGFGSPPFHPMCRGLLQATGTVTELIPVATSVTQPVLPEPAPLISVAAAVKPLTYPLADLGKEANLLALAAKLHLKVLPQAHVEILDAYTGNAHRSMNQKLRRGKYSDDLELETYIQKNIDQMDEALAATTPLAEDIQVYRGVWNPKDVFNTDELIGLVGQSFKDNGFMSTTGSLEVARGFATGPGSAVLKLRVPPGIRALVPEYVDGVLTTAEYELVLERGLVFTVTNVDTSGSYNVIELTVSNSVTKADTMAIIPDDEVNRFVYVEGDLQPA